MKTFVELFDAIDGTTKTTLKIQAIIAYLQHAQEADKVFAIAILIGNKPKRAVKTSDLRLWASELSGIPLWLLEESYYIVGDLAETLTHIIPAGTVGEDLSLCNIFADIATLKSKSYEEQRDFITGYWSQLSGSALFVFNKL